jgi:hypothetical protein
LIQSSCAGDGGHHRGGLDLLHDGCDGHCHGGSVVLGGYGVIIIVVLIFMMVVMVTVMVVVLFLVVMVV